MKIKPFFSTMKVFIFNLRILLYLIWSCKNKNKASHILVIFWYNSYNHVVLGNLFTQCETK